MRIERISIRAVTISIILLLGFLPFAHTYYIKTQYQDAALETVVKSLRRVMEVASSAVLKRIQTRTLDYANNLQHRAEFKLAVDEYKQRGASALLAQLINDPFNKGFVGAATLDLAKLRFYDLKMQLRYQSLSGRQGLPETLPGFLLEQVSKRQGVERLKAIGGVWNHHGKPLYSLLVPVGGLRLAGYLEVVVEPGFNLSEVAELVQLPMMISSSENTEVAQFRASEINADEQLAIHYELVGDDGVVAFRLVAYEDVLPLYDEMANAQMETMALFILTSGIVLVVALWLFERFLYRPFDLMLRDIRHISYGDMDRRVRHHSLKEFHVLAEAFNKMAEVVKNRTRELKALSVKDGLTGVANRRCFDEMIDKEWQSAARNNQTLSLLMLDIDFFKQYNDSQGHQQGDRCLQSIAQRIESLLHRPRDLFARYGGEEFTIILPETELPGALSVATMILEDIDKLNIPHTTSVVADHVTLSIGVATMQPFFEQGGVDLLIKTADKALYKAKAKGRHQVVSIQSKEIPGLKEFRP